MHALRNINGENHIDLIPVHGKIPHQRRIGAKKFFNMILAEIGLQLFSERLVGCVPVMLLDVRTSQMNTDPRLTLMLHEQEWIQNAFKGSLFINLTSLIGRVEEHAMALGLALMHIDETLRVDPLFAPDHVVDGSFFRLADFGPPSVGGVFKPAADVALQTYGTGNVLGNIR